MTFQHEVRFDVLLNLLVNHRISDREEQTPGKEIKFLKKYTCQNEIFKKAKVVVQKYKEKILVKCMKYNLQKFIYNAKIEKKILCKNF